MADADIAAHWAKQDIYSLIMEAAESAGIPPDSLTQETLAPLDHFHARGLASTVDLAEADGRSLREFGPGAMPTRAQPRRR